MPLYSDYYYGGSQPPPYYLPSSAYSPVTSRISSPYSYSYMSPMSLLSTGIGANPVPRGLRSYSPMLSSISETSSPLLPRRDIDHRSSPRRLAGKTFYRQPRPAVIDTERLDLSRRKKDSEDNESTPGMISRTKSIVRIHTKKLKENPDLKKKKTQAELLMEKYLIKEKPIQEKESPTKKWSWSWEENKDINKTPARRGTIKRKDSLSRVSQLPVPLVKNEQIVTSPIEDEVTPTRKMSIDSELLKAEAAIFDCLIQEELGPNNKKEVVLEDINLEGNTDSSESAVSKTKTKRDIFPYSRKKSSNKLLDENGMPLIEQKKPRIRKKKSSDKLILDEIKSSESPSDSDFKPDLSKKSMKRRSTKRKKQGGALKFKIDSLHVEEKSSPKLLRKFKYEVIVEEGNINDKHSDYVSSKEAEKIKSDNGEKDIPCRYNQEVGDVKEGYGNNKSNVQEAKCDSNINEVVNLTDDSSVPKTERYKNKFPLKGKLLQRQFSVESNSESASISPVIDKDIKAKTENEPSIQEQSQIISAVNLNENLKESSKVVKSESNSMPGSEPIHSKYLSFEFDIDRSQENGNKDINNQPHTSTTIDCDSTKSNLTDSMNFAQSRLCGAGFPPHVRPKTPDLSSPKGKLRDKVLPPHSRSNTPDLSIGKNKSFDSESSISDNSNLSDSNIFIQGKSHEKVLPPHSRSNTPDLHSPKNKISDNDSSKSSISESSSLSEAKALIQGNIYEKVLLPQSRSITPDLSIPKNKSLDLKKSPIPKNFTLPDQKPLQGKLHDKVLPPHSRSNTPDLNIGKNKSFDIESSIFDNSRSNTPDLHSPKNKISENDSSKFSISENSSLSEAKALIQGNIYEKVEVTFKPPQSRSNTPNLSNQNNKSLDDSKTSPIPKNSTLTDQKPFQGKLHDKVLPPHSRSITPDLSSPKNKSFDSESTKSSTPERSHELQPNLISAEKLREKMLPPQSRSITPDIISSKDKPSNSNSSKSSTTGSISGSDSTPLLNEKLQEKVLPPQYRSKTPDLGKTAVKNKTSKSDPNTPVLLRKQLIKQTDNNMNIGPKQMNKISSPPVTLEKCFKPDNTPKVNDPNLNNVEVASTLLNTNYQEISNNIGKQVKKNQASKENHLTNKQVSYISKETDLKTENKGQFGKPETEENTILQAKFNSEVFQTSNKDCTKNEPPTTSENVSASKGIKGNTEDKSKLISKLNKDKGTTAKVDDKAFIQDAQSILTENKTVFGKHETQNKANDVFPKTALPINKQDQTTGKNLVSKVGLKKNYEIKSANKSEGLTCNNKLKNESKVDISKAFDGNKTSSNVESKSGNKMLLLDKDGATLSSDSSKRCLLENEQSKIKPRKEGMPVEKSDSKSDNKTSSETVSEPNEQEEHTEKKEEKGSKVANKKKVRPKSESDMVENVDNNVESKTESSSVEEENTASIKSQSLSKSKSENSSNKKKKSKDKKSDSKSPKKLKKTTSNADKTKENGTKSNEKSASGKSNDGENSSELSKRSTRLMHFINKCMKLSADNESLSIDISDEEAEEESSSSEYTSDTSEYTDDSSCEEESSDEQKECDVNCHRKCEKLMPNLCGVNQKLIVEALSSVRKGSTESRDRGSPSRRQSNAALALDEVRGEPHSHHPGRVTPPATTIPKFRKYTMEDFQFLKVLGKGSFGKVLLAELRGTQYYYAVKCLKKDVVLEDDDVECTLIERKVLALGTNHPYLCHLFCTFQTDSHLFFVMEYLNGGDLMFHIQQQGRFDEGRARFYAAEITSGLKFLHKKGIVYRDLKLDNILLDFDGHVRIADFGMCKLQIYLDRTADTFCGTPDYMAPEIIKGLKYNQCVDWWSFGILLYEMLVGQSPFSGCDEDDLFWCICNRQPHYPRFISLEAKRILIHLLEKESSKRLGSCENGAAEVTGHPFFDGLDWERLERRELIPPFKPNVKHPLDVHYFDKHFTAERARLTPIDPSILQSMDQTQFQGFSYTNPNVTD